jgi:hypothetical protein
MIAWGSPWFLQEPSFQVRVVLQLFNEPTTAFALSIPAAVVRQ